MPLCVPVCLWQNVCRRKKTESRVKKPKQIEKQMHLFYDACKWPHTTNTHTYAHTLTTHTHIVREGCLWSAISHHSHSKMSLRSWPGLLICLLTFTSGCCPAAQCCTACCPPGCLPALGNSGPSSPLYSIHTEKQQSEKRKITLVFVPLCTEHWIKRGEMGKGSRPGMHTIWIRVHACVYVWRGEGGSLPLGELIQGICSASRGERGLIGTECATQLHKHTHTHFVSPTYRWAYEHPRSKIRAPITNSADSSDWSWQMLSAHQTRVMSATRDLTACHETSCESSTVCDCV